MTGARLLAVVLVVLAVLAAVAGILYLAEPAKSLPSVLPGHVAGLSAHRHKRGIAALVVAAILLIAAKRSGPVVYHRTSPASRAHHADVALEVVRLFELVAPVRAALQQTP